MKCPICSWTMVNNPSARNHLGERGQRCSKCGFSFYTQSLKGKKFSDF